MRVNAESLDFLDDRISNYFSLAEMKSSRTLIILYSLMFFNLWLKVTSSYKLLGNLVYETYCWPFLQWCKPAQNFVLLNDYAQYRPVFFTFLLCLLSLNLFFIYKQKWGISVFLTLCISLLTLFPEFIFTNGYNRLIFFQNQYLFYGLIIFFLAKSDRIKLLSLFYFLTYFYSSVPKLTSEAWVLGLLPIPFIPLSISPIATNLVILSQILFPFFIFYGNRYLRLTSIILFELFHFYTSAMVRIQYSFFWTVVPFVYLLFFENRELPEKGMFKRNTLVTLVLVVFTILSLARLLIPGQDQFTKEGSSYGLNMFNISQSLFVKYDDSSMNFISTSTRPTNFYEVLTEVKNNCVDEKERRLEIWIQTTYELRKVVDQKNYCKLSYNAWSHNDWISEGIYVEQDLSKLNKTQLFLQENSEYLYFGYLLLFGFMSLLTIYKIFFENKGK